VVVYLGNWLFLSLGVFHKLGEYLENTSDLVQDNFGLFYVEEFKSEFRKSSLFRDDDFVVANSFSQHDDLPGILSQTVDSNFIIFLLYPFSCDCPDD